MDRIALLAGEVAAFAAGLRSADLGAPVASCPGWVVRDLVAHLTGVHRWATAALASTDAPSYDEVASADPASDYLVAGEELLAALRATDPGAPAWTFDKGNRTASFWQRRQLHEVAVHRFDLDGQVCSDEVALDGVDEVMTFFAPRQIALGRTELPGGALVVRSGDRTWALGSGAAVVVEGSPSAVLLRLWGRGEPLPEGWAGLTP